MKIRGVMTGAEKTKAVGWIVFAMGVVNLLTVFVMLGGTPRFKAYQAAGSSPLYIHMVSSGPWSFLSVGGILMAIGLVLVLAGMLIGKSRKDGKGMG